MLLGTRVEGRVTIATPLGWDIYDRNRPRNVIQMLHNGIRFIRAANLPEAEKVKDDWLNAFYTRYPGEVRRFLRPTP